MDTILIVDLTALTISPIKDAADNIISLTIKDQPINENYDYYASSDVATLTGKVVSAHPRQYIEVPQGSYICYIIDSSNTDDNKVKVFYAPNPADAIPVEARIGSTTGPLIVIYSIQVKIGEILTLTASDLPDLGAFGFMLDTAASILVADESKPNDKIIAVYTDKRSTTNIKNNLDSTVISDSMVPGTIKRLYPPQKDGYNVIAYSLNGNGIRVPITSAYFGYPATTTTDITFYYEPISGGGGGNTGGGGGNTGGGGGNTGGGGGNTGGGNTGGGFICCCNDNMFCGGDSIYCGSENTCCVDNNINNDDINIDSEEGSLDIATLTLLCVGEGGNKIYSQFFQSVVAGSTETIHAPPLQGYIPAEGDYVVKVVTIQPGDNVITFKYTETDEKCHWWWIWLLIAFICGVVLRDLITRLNKKENEQQMQNQESN